MKTMTRKLRREMLLVAEEGFPVIRGMHYLLYLRHLHEARQPKVYFEIGTESGASLSFAKCTSIAVDPQFQLQADVSRNKPELHQYQGTSDDFFASAMLKRLGLTVDLAFLDGMHLFEYLLRDFINIEKFMSRDGMVVMHDCVPFNHLVAERVWDKTKTLGWTGDVWKLIPILREYRPDLKVDVLDAAPTGLVCVSNLDPMNTVLVDSYDQIVSRFQTVTLPDYTIKRLMADAQIKSLAEAEIPDGDNPTANQDDDVPLAAPQTDWGAIRRYYRWQNPTAPAPKSHRIAIKTFVGRRRSSESTGDFHLARGLADGLISLGHSVRIDSIRDWHTAPEEADLDILLYGEGEYEPPSKNPFLVWVLYPGREAFTLPESFKRAAHVFVASEKGATKAAAMYGESKTSVLLQGFDERVMTPDAQVSREGMVFVGNNHFSAFAQREVVEYAVQTGTEIKIWGAGWRRHVAAKYLQGQAFPNTELGALYRGAAAVLCDHMPVMRANGFVSNRIFDALACGSAVICDDVEGLPSEFEPYVTRCRSADDFRAAVAAICSESPSAVAARLAFAQKIRDVHSLRHRAEQIMSVVEAHSSQKKGS